MASSLAGPCHASTRLPTNYASGHTKHAGKRRAAKSKPSLAALSFFDGCAPGSPDAAVKYPETRRPDVLSRVSGTRRPPNMKRVAMREIVMSASHVYVYVFPPFHLSDVRGGGVPDRVLQGGVAVSAEPFSSYTTAQDSL